MPVLVYTHPDMLDHRPPEGHAERPERLSAVLDALNAAVDIDIEVREAPLADFEDLQRVHPKGYVGAIMSAQPHEGLVQLDPDTFLSAGSGQAARRAAGAVVAAVRAVAEAPGELRAFCAVRPPGHHAEPDKPMGFCLFSNVAVGARAAQAAGLERVAVIDFDVHHGNGTQACFATDPMLMLASLHQSPLYPGTGDPAERGVGNIVNRTVPPRAPRQLWRAAFAGMLERVDAFGPDLIMISAGFDAHAADPLANQLLEDEDFAWATANIVEVARTHSRGRVVSSLEGGYDLQALGRSAVAHVRALQGV